MGPAIISTFRPKANRQFINRLAEQEALRALDKHSGSRIAVVYGRRRVGKTELIERVFVKRKLLKFEGQENLPETEQKQEFLRQLFNYAKEPLILTSKAKSWSDIFAILTRYIEHGKFTLYFEELQWMANYKTTLISAIKYFWDNHWRYNKKLLIVLCGSSPSFIIGKVLRSRALYNRTEIDFPISAFDLSATRELLGKNRSLLEAMDAQLAVGGIPPYLQKLKNKSVYLSLAEQSFKPKSYFVTEYERIFTSSLGTNHDYRKIIELLANCAYLDRQELARKLKRPAGGSLSELLEDLELSGFITSYSPVGKKTQSKLKRYVLIDPFIRYYHQCIKPNLRKIKEGAFEKNPVSALPMPKFRTILGFSFERWVLARQHKIAALLGFAAVQYDSGPYFSRKTPGVQIDLVYERRDRVTTLVEIKYTAEPVGVEIVPDFQKKELLYPHKSKTIERVLISAMGATKALSNMGYFTRVLTLEELAEL